MLSCATPRMARNVSASGKGAAGAAGACLRRGAGARSSKTASALSNKAFSRCVSAASTVGRDRRNRWPQWRRSRISPQRRRLTPQALRNWRAASQVCRRCFAPKFPTQSHRGRVRLRRRRDGTVNSVAGVVDDDLHVVRPGEKEARDENRSIAVALGKTARSTERPSPHVPGPGRSARTARSLQSQGTQWNAWRHTPCQNGRPEHTVSVRFMPLGGKPHPGIRHSKPSHAVHDGGNAA